MKSLVSRLALLAAAALIASAPATARELRTLDGGFVQLSSVVLPANPGQGPGAQPVSMRADIAWLVRDAQGIERTGVLPGVGDLREELPLLLQNPVDGELHLIYSGVNGISRDLLMRTWLGQSWSSPVFLAGSDSADDFAPRARFTPEGELVVAWRQVQSAGEHVLFLYGQVDAQGLQATHAHLDMGPASLYTLPVAGDVRLSDGVGELLLDESGERALIFLADSVADDAGVLRLDLRALRQIIGGGSFAPVPVNFLQVAMGNGTGGLADRIAEAGDLLPTWRVELLEGEGYYWFDEETMSGAGFRGGELRGGLITVALPENEASGHAIMVARLRVAIGRIVAELEPLLARRDATERRSLR